MLVMSRCPHGKIYRDQCEQCTPSTPTDDGHTASLLGLAIGYVEAYIGRFPKNVRPEHIAAFRAWRDSHPAHVVIVIHESRNQ